MNIHHSVPSNHFYDLFEYPLTLYTYPPSHGVLSPQELVDMAIDRLEVLQFISHKIGLDESVFGSVEKFSSEVIKLLDKNSLKLTYNEASPDQIEYISLVDSVSHFLLKLAFSKNRVMRDWLILQETRLLEFKFSRFNKICITQRNFDLLDQFLRNEEMPFPRIDKPKKTDDAQSINLWNISTSFNSENVHLLYKLNIFENPDIFPLIRTREVYVKDKIAYITPGSLSGIVVSRFRKNMEKSFDLYEDRRAIFEELLLNDQRLERILYIISNIPTLGNDTSKLDNISDEYKLDLYQISKIWSISFPPCMQRLYKQLKKDNHLKHWGRQQFWLFLKGSGMTMEDSLQFNRSNWNDSSNFDKEFRYNVRHLYGQEGKRVSKPPYTCNKIIKGGIPNPGSGEYHGCPFKTMELSALKKMLLECGVKEKSLGKIEELISTHQYQLACVNVFIDKHPGSQGEGVGNHPNSFYLESRMYLANHPSPQKNLSSLLKN